MLWFILIFLLLFISGAFFFLFYFYLEAKSKNRLEKTTRRVIFKVLVPREVRRKEDQPENFRERIAQIEPFFASLVSAYEKKFKNRFFGQNYFGFEIIGDNRMVSFYVSAPKSLSGFLEKQLHAAYPAVLITKTAGHNIFKDKKEIAALTLKLAKPAIFPLRTYPNLENETLNGLTNNFSKLAENEAAAIQILARPTAPNWKKKAESFSNSFSRGEKGVTYKSLLSEVGKQVVGKPVPPEEKSPKVLNPIEEEVLRQVKEKAAKTGFETQVRLVAVGESAEESQAILEDIKSGFAQFESMGLNGWRPQKQKPGRVVADFIWQNFANAPISILNTEELAGLWHLPNKFVETPNIEWLAARTLPPPLNLPKEGIVLGESVFRGEKKLVRLLEKDRLRHLFMIGKTGTGKTTLFLNMIEQDINEGRGICFIDPMGDATLEILGRISPARLSDVILFDPSDSEHPLGLNLLEYQKEQQRDFLISEWIEIFYKLFDPARTGIVGPQWEHWGRNAALTVMAQPGGGTLIDIPNLFIDEEYRKRAIANLKDPVVKTFWEEQLAKTADFHKSEMYNYFISKFGRFMTNDLMRNIIGQTKSSFDLRAVMDQGKILLVNLSKGKIGETNAYLLGLILVAKLASAAFSRADLPEESRRPFYLYVDEFQNFTTDTFATILSEARKYRLSLNLTNQYIAQLPEMLRDAVVGNIGTLISFRIGAVDAEFLSKELAGVSVDDLINLGFTQTYVKLLVEAAPTPPFSMQGIKSKTVSQPEIARQIIENSRQKYGRKRELVESEYLARLGKSEKAEG
ncbi:type IV secretory system conjugative DNA transfer family protein [Candidatus Berkelbacteria bacterium]|nr:type IV secretory system conjugative DNA transfer family protein [Candidatus Berkelbacteria bacterium]